MSFSERLKKMANITLIKLKQEPITICPGPHKFNPSATADDNMSASMQARRLNEVKDVVKDQSSTTELDINPTVHGSHLQTLSKFNKLSECTRETKADIREQMDKLETYKANQKG